MTFEDIGAYVSDGYAVGILERNEEDKVEYLLENYFPLEDAALLPKGNYEVAEIMLETASILQGKNMVSERIANLLIDHMSSRIYLIDFLQVFLRRCNCFVRIDASKLDQTLTNAIMQAHLYDEKICNTVADLNQGQFLSLCHYIIDCFSEDENLLYDCRIGRPIVRYIYDHELIPRESLFMYLRLSLCRYEIVSFEELISTMQDFYDDDGIPPIPQ